MTGSWAIWWWAYAAQNNPVQLKLFWENYNECLHCPGVHPRLAQLVPLFGRALLERATIRAGRITPTTTIRSTGRIAHRSRVMSMDGKPVGVPFPGVSPRPQGRPPVPDLCASMFIVHTWTTCASYVCGARTERTEMSIEFSFLPETLADPKRDLMNAVSSQTSS